MVVEGGGVLATGGQGYWGSLSWENGPVGERSGGRTVWGEQSGENGPEGERSGENSLRENGPAGEWSGGDWSGWENVLNHSNHNLITTNWPVTTVTTIWTVNTNWPVTIVTTNHK